MKKLLAVLSLWTLALGVAVSQDGAVFSRARGAIGHEAIGKAMEKTGGIRLTGKADFLGTKGDYSLLLGRSGEFLEEISTELGQVTGWDGTTGWSTDWSHMPRVLELEDLESEQAVFWVLSGRWLDKDSPFEMKVVDGTNPPQMKLKLRDKVLEADLFLDENYRPMKMVRESSAGNDIYEFKDYTKQLGFYIAHTFSIQSGGMTHTFTISNVERAPIFIRNPYAPLLTPPADTKFDAGASPNVESKRAFSGHMLVHPLVNGKDVGWFIFDSGAGSMVIDPKIADDLGLAKVGKIPAVGVGGVVAACFRKGDSFTLGPATYEKPVFVELDLSAIGNAFGVKLAGICGYDVISRAVVEVEFARGRVSVYDPKDYKLAKTTWIPLHMDGKHPIVTAKFPEKNEGLFRLDTGANNAVVFHTPAVNRLKLLDGRDTHASSLAGVGGAMESRSGKIEWFELAGNRIENLTVDFSQAKIGPFADKYTLGNLGQRVLSPFTIVFDYGKRRIAFIPREK